MKKQDLITAAEDLNELLFNAEEKEEGWIFVENTSTLKSEIKKAAMLLYAGDEITATTVEVLKSFTWSEEDFKNMGDDVDPVPALIRYEIIPDPAAAVIEEKPKRKPRKKKEPAPEPEPEPEVIVEAVEEVPEGKKADDDEPEVIEVDYAEAEEKVEKKPTEKVSKPVEAEPEMSAYSFAMEAMGPDPTKSLQALTREMADKGYDMFTVGNSTKTAHSIFRKVYRILRENGHIDGAR